MTNYNQNTDNIKESERSNGLLNKNSLNNNNNNMKFINDNGIKAGESKSL
jgi:hypothetical protein